MLSVRASVGSAHGVSDCIVVSDAEDGGGNSACSTWFDVTE